MNLVTSEYRVNIGASNYTPQSYDVNFLKGEAVYIKETAVSKYRVRNLLKQSGAVGTPINWPVKPGDEMKLTIKTPVKWFWEK